MGNALLVLDDERAFAALVKTVAEQLGFVVTLAANAHDFKHQVKTAPPDQIVLDIVMPDVDGIELVRWLVAEEWCHDLLLVTGYDPRYSSAAKLIGDVSGRMKIQTLFKPVKLADLRAALGTPQMDPEPPAAG